MTGKLIFLLSILFGLILLGSVILGDTCADLTDQETMFPVELSQTRVADLLEQVDDGDNPNYLRPTGHDNGLIEPIAPKYPQNPKDRCNRKAQWKQILKLPCGSAWGG